MAAGGLTVERETAHFALSHDLFVSKVREPAHFALQP
jgi:hypothetical protein